MGRAFRLAMIDERTAGRHDAPLDARQANSQTAMRRCLLSFLSVVFHGVHRPRPVGREVGKQLEQPLSLASSPLHLQIPSFSGIDTLLNERLTWLQRYRGGLTRRRRLGEYD
jgi:hypothetical protein